MLPLEQDHLSTLLLARNIELGSPQMNVHSLTFPQKIDFARKYFETRLAPHHDAEEKILFSIIRQFSRDNDAIIEQLIEDHSRIRSLIESLGRAVSKRQILNDLGKLLEGHILREEKFIFHNVRQILPEEILKSAEEEIQKYFDSRLHL